MHDIKMNIRTAKGKETNVNVEQGDGINIWHVNDNTHSLICWLVHDEGDMPKLMVYADPENEEPTHIIHLDKIIK